jgi:hypothetical protein
MAAATARLSVTTGLPVIWSSSPYSARICAQSVSSTRAARSWDRCYGCLELVLAEGPQGNGTVEQAGALGDRGLVPP